MQGPLRVLQHSPAGESGVVRSVSITFSQPMVAPGVYKAAGAAALSPAAEGEWSWVDATTLEFRAAGRLAMATTYKVTSRRGSRR